MATDSFLNPGDVELILAGVILLGALVWQFAGRIQQALIAEYFSDSQRSTVGYCIVLGALVVAVAAVQQWAQWTYNQAVLWGPE